MADATLGAKSNDNDVITFTAKESGLITVTVDITSCNEGDALALGVNYDYNGPYMTTANQTSTLTAPVNEGDIISLYALDPGTTYYGKIDVSYHSDVSAEALTVANNSILFIGYINLSQINNYSAVGFDFTTSESEKTVSKEMSTVYRLVQYNGAIGLIVDNMVQFGYAVNDITAGSTITATPYVKTLDGTKISGEPVTFTATAV